MSEDRRLQITRRTALTWGIAGLLSAAVAAQNVFTARAVGTATSAATATAATEEEPAGPPPRFRFDCVAPVPLFAPLTRVEEVWASPRYLTFTGCRVRYVGEGPFVLTAEEEAIVEVVADAGGDVEDRTGTYLRVLSASTRIDPARFDDALADFGAPVVTGALAFAADAPHAHLMRRWLDGVGGTPPGTGG